MMLWALGAGIIQLIYYKMVAGAKWVANWIAEMGNTEIICERETKITIRVLSKSLTKILRQQIDA